jgi:hypothetical protein
MNGRCTVYPNSVERNRPDQSSVRFVTLPVPGVTDGPHGTYPQLTSAFSFLKHPYSFDLCAAARSIFGSNVNYTNSRLHLLSSFAHEKIFCNPVRRQHRQCHLKTSHTFLGETLKLARPDFQLFEYLWEKRLIDKGEFEQLKGNDWLSQLPPSLATSQRSETRDRSPHLNVSRTEIIRTGGHLGEDTEYGSIMPTDETAAIPHFSDLEPSTAPVQPNPDSPCCTPSGLGIATTNPQMDSGYGSMATPTVDLDDDTMSIGSIITNASRVSMHGTEKTQVTSAFSGDLCQDVRLRQLSADAREGILARLPDLLKMFAIRLEESATSRAESDAKEFLRQQRG